MTSAKDRRIYRFVYAVINVILRSVYWVRYEGRENIPEGAVIVCGNHSSWVDPFLIALGMRSKDILHMMGKAELFKNRFLAWLLRKLGAFPVNRSGVDVTAVKTAVRYIKNGEKIGIFPEGTRARHDGDVEAKKGAIRISEMSKARMLPVYIPREKRLFKRFTIVFGESYSIPKSRDRSEEHYSELSRDLMNRINSLKVEE